MTAHDVRRDQDIHKLKELQDVTKITISLPAKYPFAEPSVAINTPIFHPNVYKSGLICLGTGWLPTQGLDLLVKKIMQIITFDPSILNEKSPANTEALFWYREAKKTHAQSFPTDSLSFSESAPSKQLRWNDVSAQAEKTVVTCPKCQKSLRLPAGKAGRVNCPGCGNVFQAAT